MFQQLNSTLLAIQTDIKDFKSVKEQVSAFSKEWKESVDTELKSIDNRGDKHEFRLNLMANMLINQEEKLQNLEHRVTSSYMREIKPNLIVHGILEDKEEDRSTLVEKTKSFFKEKMEITETIEICDAFRMGQGSNRPILIKLAYPNDKAIIFANAKNLKGKENAKKRLFFVHDDLTDEQSEVRMTYRELNIENKETDEEEKLTVKMRKGRIVVNNEEVKQKLHPPKKMDILRMNESELEEARAIKMASGPKHIEKGNEFLSYATKVKSIGQIRKAYTKLRIKHADALHISCGYRLENPIGPYRQEAVDDKDCGMGRAILRVLKSKEITEMAVFTVRYFSGVHLGKRRFEIIEQITEGAVQAWNTKQLKQRQRSQRQNSQTSLMSVASTIDSQDEGSDGEAQAHG